MSKSEEISTMLNPSESKRIYNDAIEARNHYKQVVRNIRESGRTQVRFAAFVVYGSSFGLDKVFRIMMEKNKSWDPKVVIIPDVLRGGKHMLDTYKKTYEEFVNKYGQKYVIDGYDIESGAFYDLLDSFDIVYYANPYDCMVNEVHSIKYASQKNVLPIHVSYGYDIGKYTTMGRLSSEELNLAWKVFADTKYSYKDYKRYQVIRGKNVVLTGYSKMDDIERWGVKGQKREKRILIAPHHTVVSKELPLSNFLSYYDLITELPDMYPDIEFVFRPHPLLFAALVNNNLWTEGEVSDYLELIEKKGIVYSYEPDYLHLYHDCDAIIHDCGSFAVEWLFTGKPGCFVYNEQLSEDMLTDLMNNSMSCYEIATCRKDIVNFIDKCISTDFTNGLSVPNDKALQKRMIIIERFFSGERKERLKRDTYRKWFKKNISICFPYTSERIIDELSIVK